MKQNMRNKVICRWSVHGSMPPRDKIFNYIAQNIFLKYYIRIPVVENFIMWWHAATDKFSTIRT